MTRTAQSRLRLGSGGQRGSATLELAILAPALLALIGFAVLAGRIVVADGAVEQAAAAAAREASLARTPTAARTAADTAAADALRQQGITCTPLTVSVDTAGFAVPVGVPAQVSATVSCTLALGDLGVPGLPARTHTETMTSPLDTWRGR